MVDLMTTDRQFLRPDEVVDILSVPRRTVYNWIETGKIPSVQIGRLYRIPVPAFRAYVRHQVWLRRRETDANRATSAI